MSVVYEENLNRLKAENRLRRIPEEGVGIDLVSNDYMGLAARYSEFIPEFLDRYGDAPMSASASRLLQRTQKYHKELENFLDSLYSSECGKCGEKHTLLFNSGYHANVGCISALSVPETLVVSDKLAHASMIDGIRLGKGDSVRFPHNDMHALRRILERKASEYRHVIVVTEAVFSMDGDKAPLRTLVDLKNEFPNVMLYVDEAHSFGVMGDRGLGLSEQEGVTGDIDIIVGTLGKAAAGSGAFIAASPLVRDYLLNNARSFIFSTALPPSVVAWDLLMIEKLTGMLKERRHLAELSRWMREEVERVTGISNASRSQIIPVHAGSADRAVKMAEALRNVGFDSLPIRRPTVAAGTERLRLSLSCTLTSDCLDRAIVKIGEFSNADIEKDSK